MKPFNLEEVKARWEEAQAGTLLVTRAGKPVRLYALDGIGELSIHGATWVGGGWEYDLWSSSGRRQYMTKDKPHDEDLVFATEKKWAVLCESKETAELLARVISGLDGECSVRKTLMPSRLAREIKEIEV
jgi:hypothetical protein